MTQGTRHPRTYTLSFRPNIKSYFCSFSYQEFNFQTSPLCYPASLPCASPRIFPPCHAALGCRGGLCALSAADVRSAEQVCRQKEPGCRSGPAGKKNASDVCGTLLHEGPQTDEKHTHTYTIQSTCTGKCNISDGKDRGMKFSMSALR